MNLILGFLSPLLASFQLGKSRLSILFVVLCLTTSVSSAARISGPIGLAPGYPYRLIFTTGGIIAPTSFNIQTYNNFVATEAALPNSLVRDLKTTWTAVASTQFVAARINTATDPSPPWTNGVPIYLVDGATEIANNYDDLWDGTINAPIGLTQFGTAPTGVGEMHPSTVWTGTRSDGTSYIGFIPFSMGTDSVVAGSSSFTHSSWISGSTIAVAGIAGDRRAHIYAISGVLTAVPEPTSGTLLAVLSALVATHRRRHRTVAFKL